MKFLGIIFTMFVMLASNAFGQNQTYQQTSILLENAGDVSHGFGLAVSMHGDYAVVGAPYYANGNGAAYVFRRSGASWVKVATLTNPPGGGDSVLFGASVSIDEDRIVIGTGTYLFNTQFAGAVFVYKRSSSAWLFEAKLTPNVIGSGYRFGYSVDIDDDTVIVGAPYEDVGPNTAQGSVYLFKRNSSAWTLQSKINNLSGAAEDHFGHSVAIDGETAIVGSYHYTMPDYISYGTAHVFRRYGSNWSMEQQLYPINDPGEAIGYAVDISFNTAVVSAYKVYVSYPNPHTKPVYIFQRTGSIWEQQTKLTNSGDPDRLFGSSVAVSGNAVAVGAPGYGYNNVGYPGGAVYMFHRSIYNNSWDEVDEVIPDGNQWEYSFGNSVDLGSMPFSSKMISGAHERSNGNVLTGAAYIFRLSRGPWVELPRMIPKFRFIWDTDWNADLGLYQNGTWKMFGTLNGPDIVKFGQQGDIPVHADFDGDGITDIAVFRDGTWLIEQSRGGSRTIDFGKAGDIPVPGHFDRDSKADPAVFRNGTWLMLKSDGRIETMQLGRENDQPLAADFDGDQIFDPAVFSNGVWYWRSSRDGKVSEVRLGRDGDIPVVEDYDGDMVADFAVFSNGDWLIQQSREGFKQFRFGDANGTPAPSDYDGDGKADPAVFSRGIWQIDQTLAGPAEFDFGSDGDMPL